MKIIRLSLHILLVLCLTAMTTRAQIEQAESLNIGDPAPPLRVREWIKGSPVHKFEKGMVYVVEFWATWCAPCRAAMPHLSALGHEYKDKVTILGIDVKEMQSTPMEKVKAFVDSMGYKMDYHVGTEDSNYMAASWMEAAGEDGIPKTFVVNADKQLAWIGHPKDLGKVLLKILNNDWDIKEALAKRNLDKHLKELDDSLNYELINYSGDYHRQDYIGQPDSALLAIYDIITTEPKLQYAPFIAFHTFCSLLKTNQRKAYQYGKEVLATPTYEEPAYDAIISAIEVYSDKLNIPEEIYRLGAEAHQMAIDQFPYRELLNLPKRYNKMVEWYWRAKEKSKAIDAQQKAIEAAKNKQGFKATEMTAFKFRLQQYKDM
jgi:thiol-disulfide isomerase/thioredoxin